jgi:hypothetical protein
MTKSQFGVELHLTQVVLACFSGWLRGSAIGRTKQFPGFWAAPRDAILEPILPLIAGQIHSTRCAAGSTIGEPRPGRSRQRFRPAAVVRPDNRDGLSRRFGGSSVRAVEPYSEKPR